MTESSKTPVQPSATERKTLMWLGGFIAGSCLLTGGIAATIVASLQFFVITPIDTYEDLYSPQWKSLNADLMQLKSAADFDKAEARLSAMMRKTGNNPVPHYLLGILYDTQEKDVRAAHHYVAALKQIKTTFFSQVRYQYVTDDLLSRMALIYYEDGRPQDSARLLNSIINWSDLPRPELVHSLRNVLENPERADFRWKLAKAYRGVLNLPMARRELEKALELSTDPALKVEIVNYTHTHMPGSVTSLSPLARYLSMAGDSLEENGDDLVQAAFFYEEALRNSPNFEMAYNDLAIVYRQLKDYERATRLARQALELNGNFYHPYLTLGDIELDREDYPAAIAHFESARQIIRQFPSAESRELTVNLENQIGYAYEQLRNLDKAEEHYRLALVAAEEFTDSDVHDQEYAAEALGRIAEARQQKLGQQISTAE